MSDWNREALKQAIQRHVALTPGLPLTIDAAVVMQLLREAEGARSCECGATATVCGQCVDIWLSEARFQGEYE